MTVKLKVTQLRPTFCNPMDCSPPSSSIHGILQVRILEWVAMPFPRDWILVSSLQADSLRTIFISSEEFEWSPSLTWRAFYGSGRRHITLKMSGLPFITQKWRGKGRVLMFMQVHVPNTQWGQTNWKSEFGAKKYLFQGHARRWGGSCPKKPWAPWRVLANHLKSHMREGASQGTW